MIVVDGTTIDMQGQGFANLEELLLKVMEDKYMDDRVVTDVLVDNETFSEIYPHQAEDISSDEFSSVEIRTVPVQDMAVNITRELYKVVNLMDHGSRQVAELFRQADDGEALEMYQDLLDVVRDFIGMISVLRDEFSLKDHKELQESSNEVNVLFGEMCEVMENEDWILLSDLLEYEFIPAVNKWKKIIALLREDIKEYEA
ncbi:MAG: hypothetical protein D6E12_00485 [Desulfovibrio sp.]|nr:MAG: hypothetical protein D6E12_00485 [Desulfovibrio sp.]